MTYHKKVIPFKQSDSWRFFGFKSGNNRPVDDWYKGLSEEAKFAVRDGLKDARKIEDPRNWLCFKRYLKGKLRKYKIWELWFSCGDNRQYRLLGIFGSERKQAIFLVGCYHKERVYTPADALETAFNRARDLSEGRAEIYERKIPTDQ